MHVFASVPAKCWLLVSFTAASLSACGASSASPYWLEPEAGVENVDDSGGNASLPSGSSGATESARSTGSGNAGSSGGSQPGGASSSDAAASAGNGTSDAGACSMGCATAADCQRNCGPTPVPGYTWCCGSSICYALSSSCPGGSSGSSAGSSSNTGQTGSSSGSSGSGSGFRGGSSSSSGGSSGSDGGRQCGGAMQACCPRDAGVSRCQSGLSCSNGMCE
jgi:hypothetical protein